MSGRKLQSPTKSGSGPGRRPGLGCPQGDSSMAGTELHLGRGRLFSLGRFLSDLGRLFLWPLRRVDVAASSESNSWEGSGS